MAEKEITKDDNGIDFLGIAKHFAKHTAQELARLLDAKMHVERLEITNGYTPEIVSLDALGNHIVNIKESTRTIIIQKQGGHLDGTTILIGGLSLTYPANTILIDSIHVLTISQTMTIAGVKGDSYILIQSAIPNVSLSDYFSN